MEFLAGVATTVIDLPPHFFYVNLTLEVEKKLLVVERLMYVAIYSNYMLLKKLSTICSCVRDKKKK